MTAAAGIAHTSERSIAPTASALLLMSTERSGRISVDSGLNATRTRSGSPVLMPPSVPPEAMLGGVVTDFVVQFGPANPARGESQPELDALGGLQAEQREREAAVEFAIPLHVTAEADRQSGRDDLDDTAERVAGFFARVDFRDNFAFSIRVSDAHLRRFGDAAQLRNAQLRMRLRLGRADARDVTQHVDSEWR